MRSLVLVAYNVLRLLTWPVRALYGLRYRRKPRWVRVRLHGKVEELPPRPTRLMRLLRGASEARSVLAVRRLAARAGEDPALEGVLLQVEQLEASHATLGALRAELAALRAHGKKIVCFLPFGADQRELFLASAADRVLAMPHAPFTALGPLASRTYVAPLLRRAGIDLVVTAEGRYKTAAEPLLRDTMSGPEREQLEAIVRTLLDHWVEAVASRPAVGLDGAKALLEKGVFGASEAEQLGAIDARRYEDELRGELALAKGEAVIEHDAYLRRPTANAALFVPLKRRKVVAVVRLVGTIGTRNVGRGIEFQSSAALLRGLARDPRVAGVIVHIDSPGGSALVSELLHRELKRLDAEKPVVAWMGGVAASGGYYLAAAARAIVAQPSTLTGSIGVISLRPVARRLFSMLELKREVVGLTPHADLHSLVRPPSEPEQALLKAESERFYARFLDVVAEGRKRPRDQIAALAEGRVWSGADAHREGLVDTLGGYEQARRELGAWVELAQLDAEPRLVSPPMRSTRLPFPASVAPGQISLDAIAGALDLLPASVAPELDLLNELLGLAAAGDRVLAYALGLPRI